MATDDGASYLGEVALVDGDSRVRKTGLVFFDTLFDENAACHIAWGQGIKGALDGGEEMSDEELAAHGYNDSVVHTDFMVGGPGVSVLGVEAEAPRCRSSTTTPGSCPTRGATSWPRCRRVALSLSRAHSSAGERSLHTREVPGSIPGAPMDGGSIFDGANDPVLSPDLDREQPRRPDARETLLVAADVPPEPRIHTASRRRHVLTPGRPRFSL